VFLGEAAQLVAAHGGSLSGEHGDGQARAELLPLMYSRSAIRVFEEFKAIWDPGNGLNPGKVVHPFRIDDNLRVGPRSALATVFPYLADGGDFARAIDRCIGVGKCRSTRTGAVMCPSYRVTRDERDSTRGHVRVLQEMLSGDVVTGDGARRRSATRSTSACRARAVTPTAPSRSTWRPTSRSSFTTTTRRRLRPAAHYGP
jgi:hypothetical protein